MGDTRRGDALGAVDLTGFNLLGVVISPSILLASAWANHCELGRLPNSFVCSQSGQHEYNADEYIGWY